MKLRTILIVAAVCVLLTVLGWLLLHMGEQEEVVQIPTDKVGMVLNGSAEDRGFSQALHEAARDVCREKDLEFVSYDGVPAEAFRSMTLQLIDQGCTLILCDSEAFDQELVTLAKENPQICFLNAMGTVKGHNLASCMRRTYQARYLTGMVAGLQTETDEIGYVVSSLTLETIRQLNAFTLGVRRVNPDARVYVRCTEDRYSEEKATAAAGELLDAHAIDILTVHAVPISALAEADRRGVWTIGYSASGQVPFPDTWLTGYTFDWKPFYAQRIEEWQTHRFVGKQYRGGIRNGLVSLAPLSHLVRDETKEAVDRELERLMEGSFDVFFGPVTDIYGTLQVREDETMSDDRILHGMYWYVEGVVLE